MVRRRATGMALLAGAVAGGAALGYLAERRVMGGARLTDDPEWAALHAPLDADERTVVSSDGTRLHVLAAGPPDAPVLVLAHGYGLGARSWIHQLRDLSDELRVVAYDQRGHGRSGTAARGDHSIEALGRDLAAVIAAVAPPGDPRTVVAGHSMGGMSVMAYADGHPEHLLGHVAGVALVSTGASRLLTGSAFSTGVAALGAVEQRVGERLLGRTLPGGQVASDLSFLLTRAVGLHPDASPAHVAFVEQLLIDMPREARAAFAHTLGSLDLTTALARLPVPAVVMVGDADRLTPRAQAIALAEALPDATYLEVPDAGHHLPLEAHAAVSDALRAHVRAALEQGPRVGGAPPEATSRGGRLRAAVQTVRERRGRRA
jgi:pimeloyl-ACP methyl ester carboxylesterase